MTVAPFYLSLRLWLVLLTASSTVLTYELSPVDGQADIGAHHVQPGRCAGVERRLGRRTYGDFFRPSPFKTTFSSISSSISGVDDAGSGIEAMDSTSLCSFNPRLTEGYGAGFSNIASYLIYSRCLYGTNYMRVICGTSDGNGKPKEEIPNLVVEAQCPSGTKCKNFCATMVDPSLASPYAAKQVQLAQCLPIPQWEKLTDMYKPKPRWFNYDSLLKIKTGGGVGSAGGDPKVVDKVPEGDPAKDPTQTDKDGTIAGKVLISGASDAKPESKKQPKSKTDTGMHTTTHLSEGLTFPGSVHMPTGNKPNDPIEQQQKQDQKDKLPPQKALTDMGFRKRTLQYDLSSSSGSGTRGFIHSFHTGQMKHDPHKGQQSKRSADPASQITIPLSSVDKPIQPKAQQQQHEKDPDGPLTPQKDPLPGKKGPLHRHHRHLRSRILHQH
ncbi:uncharacterized protein MEPE_00576 [Melanopsichium pennsylvanicum]|uniref:Uncharacterized protein n=2 Tax=Melanopsichium pennsylvanicum TaxID=63383 RepID=A0AAJ5C2S9_9BASI|nr:uncharacterized protein MEPE_00576 [Melanopsichium pennsylvanicum]